MTSLDPSHGLSWPRCIAAVVVMTCAWSTDAEAGPVPVSTTAELQDAVANAAPGDEIILAPGTYHRALPERRRHLRQRGPEFADLQQHAL